MEKIQSFRVDHDYIVPGMYLSRRDGDISTYDLRTRRPNAGDYMDDLTMHSVEHMMATYLRNGPYADRIIYFGPMGCQTGFYLLMRDVTDAQALEAVLDALRRTVSHTGAVFGATRKECGNYRNLSLEAAQRECRAYLAVLTSSPVSFAYPAGDA